MKHKLSNASVILNLFQNLLPSYHLKKLSRGQKRYFDLLLGAFLILAVPLVITQFIQPKTASSVWLDDDWGYRYPITITNSTGAVQTNLQKLLTIDTSTLVTAGKLQSACQDLRFTDNNGKVIPYYIDSGCNTTTTKVWVYVWNIPTNGSNIYMYYGNPTAVSGSSTKYFDNVVGLVGYWTMNDTSGSTATDSSVNANNGTATGTTIGTGQVGSDRVFTRASSEFVSVGNTVASRITGNLVISTWVNLSSTGIVQTIVSKWDGTRSAGDRNSYILFVNASNQVDFRVSPDGTSTDNSTTSSMALSSGAWYHIEAVYNGSTLQIYINGVTNGTPLTYSGGIASTGAALEFGRNDSGSNYFNGQIDDVHIYNTARTASQIQSDYTKTYTIQTSPLTVTTANGSEEKAPSPVAYWKFDDATGTTAQDSTTNNNDGTLTNSPTWQTEDMCISGKCLYFDGTDDYVSVNDTSILDFATTDSFNISFWLRTGDTGSITNLVTKYPGSNTYYTVELRNSGKVYFEIHDGTNVPSVTGTSAVNDNKWHFISAIRSVSADKLYIYVDGIEQASTTDTTTATLANSGNLTIGDLPSVINRQLTGFIDEPKIYNYARSAAQIQADYNSRANSEGVSSVLGTASNNNYKALNNGLVGYWKMDESSWTNNCSTTSVTDSSGNGNNGKACPNSTGPTGGAAGKFGNAGSFDGSNDYVEVADASSLDVTQLTLSAWINATALGGRVIDKITAGGADGYLMDTSGNKIRICSNACVSSTTTLSTGSWQHIVITFDGTTTRFYLNGAADGSSTSITSISTNALTLRLGAASSGTSVFNGKIDEARVYNRALSSAEVSTLYNFAPGPVASYNFDENTGSTVNDRSGNANTGTWNGSGSPHWKPGKNGSAGNFDGSTDYVEVADNNSLDPTVITVSLWVKPTNLTSSPVLVGHGDNSTGWYVQFQSSTGKIWFCTIASCQLTTNGVLTAGSWQHLLITHDGINNKYYINGNLTDTIAETTAITNYAGTLRFGHYSSGSTYFTGSIDDVKVYNYARTQQQIIEDMTNGSDVGGSGYASANSSTGGSIAKPVGYWKFDEGYGTTANNVGNGGTALNGTLTGMSSPATSTSGWTQAGKVGKGLVFDGTNDYVDIADNTALYSSSETVSAWFNCRNFVSGGIGCNIVDKRSSDDEFSLYVTTSLFPAALIYPATGSQISVTSNTPISLNSWNHVALVINGTAVTLYLNGVSVATGTLATNLRNGTAPLRVGNDSPRSWGEIVIDELKFYNFALTADQVKLDMNQGSAQILGSISDNLSYQKQAANQEYCVPGDTTTCTAPVGRWDFDEATGTTANDSSGNANTGTWNGTGTSRWKPGKVNKSGNFNGSDDYVSTANASSTAMPYTIEAWVKLNSLPSTYRAGIVTYRVADNNYDKVLYISTSGTPGLYVYDSSGHWVDGTTTIATGQWYHLAASVSSGGVKVYVNGKLENSTADTSTIVNAANWRIGWGSTAPAAQYRLDYVNGQMDQVRIFNYARSAAQVAWDYNKGAPVGHWRMDECQGTVANDASGNSNTGTITIGASGTQTGAGTCTDGLSTSAWANGKTGKRNYSLNFDGTDDYIDAGGSSSILGLTQGTFSAWVKFANNTTIASIGGVGNGGNGNSSQWGLQYRGDDQKELQIYSYPTDGAAANLSALTPNNTITDTNWHFIVVTVDSSNLKVYVDGVSQTLTGTVSNKFFGNAATASKITFGRHYQTVNPNYLNGQLDDARVYNYPLTATQVKNIFNDGAANYGPVTGAP